MFTDLHVQWAAVAFGWLADFSLRILIQVTLGWLGATSVFVAPSLHKPLHVFILALLLGATATGGFIAARIAGAAFTLHGLLVGVTSILAAAASNPGLAPVPRLLVAVQALGLLSGALGGLLAFYVTRARTSRR
ncbi:MAG: TIGR04086 family membrane protein [Oscillochloridaceae bacterium]|nr:TIGR04086 family membrane protein [Chloroflexaceae bacterium]MDW8390981.1 TIGR04086 family membrane protein [Oscillochloridaceae bacterium]